MCIVASQENFNKVKMKKECVGYAKCEMQCNGKWKTIIWWNCQPAEHMDVCVCVTYTHNTYELLEE